MKNKTKTPKLDKFNLHYQLNKSTHYYQNYDNDDLKQIK